MTTPLLANWRDQIRDPGGEGGGQWVHSPSAGEVLKDVLKLGSRKRNRTELAPGEELLGSDVLSGKEGAEVLMAFTRRGDGSRTVRIATRVEDKKDWGANNRGGTAVLDERGIGRLRNELDRMGDAEKEYKAKYKAADARYEKTRNAEQAALRKDYPHLGAAERAEYDSLSETIEAESWNAEYASERFRAAAARNLAAAKARVETMLGGPPSPALAAATADRMSAFAGFEDLEDLDLVAGVVPGEWADVGFISGSNDVGDVTHYIEIRPADVDDDWSPRDEDGSPLTTAELKKLSKMLAAGMGEPVNASAITATIPYDPPHAPAGSSTGGQFTTPGGGKSGTSTGTKQGMGRRKSRPGRRGKPKADPNILSYDPSTNRGTGYDKRGGDERVKSLQSALNRLGLTDLKGRRLRLDGKLGPLTTSAVKKAQKKLGLPQDGKVTLELLKQLVESKSLKPVHAADFTPSLHLHGDGGRFINMPDLPDVDEDDGKAPEFADFFDLLATTKGGGRHMALVRDLDGYGTSRTAGQLLVVVRSEDGGPSKWDEDDVFGAIEFRPQDARAAADALDSLKAKAKTFHPDASAEDGMQMIGLVAIPGHGIGAWYDRDGDLGAEGSNVYGVDVDGRAGADWGDDPMSVLDTQYESIHLSESEATSFATGLRKLADAAPVTAAAGKDVTPGHDELHHYWTKGEGLAKWASSPTPWTTLVNHLTKYVGPLKAKTYASRWFIEVFGYAAGSDKNRVAHGKPPRGDVVGPG